MYSWTIECFHSFKRAQNEHFTRPWLKDAMTMFKPLLISHSMTALGMKIRYKVLPPLNIGTSSVSNLFSQFNRAFNLVRYQLLLTWDSRSSYHSLMPTIGSTLTDGDLDQPSHSQLQNSVPAR